jgi:hypothetical protein
MNRKLYRIRTEVLHSVRQQVAGPLNWPYPSHYKVSCASEWRWARDGAEVADVLWAVQGDLNEKGMH